MKASLQIAIAASLTGLLMVSAGAQAAGAAVVDDVQRDVNQQQRIEQGLQSGQLTTQEAGKLEREATAVDRMEKRDLRNDSVSPREQRRLTAAQNKVSSNIYAEKHDAATGHPNSASSQRMQADVQRNVNQQTRIEQGAQSGALTNREVGTLERGQAHVDAREARAAANGRVGRVEQAGIQRSEDRQSRRVFRKKHNPIVAG